VCLQNTQAPAKKLYSSTAAAVNSSLSSHREHSNHSSRCEASLHQTEFSQVHCCHSTSARETPEQGTAEDTEITATTRMLFPLLDCDLYHLHSTSTPEHPRMPQLHTQLTAVLRADQIVTCGTPVRTTNVTLPHNTNPETELPVAVDSACTAMKSHATCVTEGTCSCVAHRVSLHTTHHQTEETCLPRFIRASSIPNKQAVPTSQNPNTQHTCIVSFTHHAGSCNITSHKKMSQHALTHQHHHAAVLQAASQQQQQHATS
jgi:hypothetical protein